MSTKGTSSSLSGVITASALLSGGELEVEESSEFERVLCLRRGASASEQAVSMPLITVLAVGGRGPCPKRSGLRGSTVLAGQICLSLHHCYHYLGAYKIRLQWRSRMTRTWGWLGVEWIAAEMPTSPTHT